MSGVLIVSEVRMYREGIRDALESRDDLRPVYTAGSRQEAWRQLSHVGPTVALIDTMSPEFPELLKMISTGFPSTLVVVLGLTDEREEVLAYAEDGIAGYVVKDASFDDLAATITCAVRHELKCSPLVAGALLKRVGSLAARRHTEGHVAELTPRELEVARLVKDGLGNKEIATALGISVGTTKSHVHHILEKLGVKQRRQIRRHLSGD